ncbi:heme biosynthesis HemY N-terminal domain-containing protein [Limobrevibacterium gyesilva]|uniref:Heme biosynthesis protein HemY n=1 Tax=Limobrevibacterium gyesilva TaxID=2991712 RepID=A0AA42CH43_9PROT|nr:heme biosynthesis HemY N-terminal domain-containing protein [Limobrevibacterium gyesilva]MCW3474602.1 heme biosynthesis protein HemY [Limobrevibacterium gyesilva]
MVRILWVLAASAVAVALAWSVAGLPGHVAATVGGYTFEASTPVAAIALAVLVLVLYLLLRLLGTLVTLPRRWRRWRERRRRERGDAAVTRTLVALAAADAGEARRQAQRARALLGDTPQTLLLAAEAARLAGSEAEAEALYHQLAAGEDAAFLGLRGLFRLAIAREDWSAAADLARRAEAAHPGNAWLREERTMLAVRVGDWTQALALAGPDAPHAAYVTAAAESAIDPAQALKLARRAWKDNPAFTPAALAYAKRLRQSGREGRAQEVLRETWKLAPNPEMAESALAATSDKMARMQLAERLVQGAPDHPESRLLLARVALEAGLTGEARRHGEAARRAGLNQKRLWLLIADLEAEEHGDTEAGRLAQRDALRHAATAEPDPAWRCDACGTVHAQWHPACPACHTPGRIVWGEPVRLALAAS